MTLEEREVRREYNIWRRHSKDAKPRKLFKSWARLSIGHRSRWTNLVSVGGEYEKRSYASMIRFNAGASPYKTSKRDHSHSGLECA
jgi:hypothetical protein